MGSHADRHWHIGRGRIGSEGFRRIVNHPSLRRLPGIMETPRMSTRDDLRNLGVIVGLAASRR
jgi:endonuclease IV